MPSHSSAVCLVVVLSIAWLARAAASLLRQPAVIGEITAGLLVGPVLLWLFGTRVFDLVLPSSVLGALKFFAEIGLALFLVGLIHDLRLGPAVRGRRATGWVVAGALVPSLLAGALLAGWVLLTGDVAVRGTAPLPAFVLFVAVALSITAVPVLARIMSDRGLMETPAGRLALTGAVVIDAVGWLLLSVALGLRTGSLTGFARVIALLLGGALVALLVRYVLRNRVAGSCGARFPRLSAVLLGLVATTAALSAERLGLTLPFGAALVGLAIPTGDESPWAPMMSSVTRAGRALVPVFFVVTGVTVLIAGFSSAPWTLMVLATGLGIAGKILGGYLGGRLGAQSRRTALQIGVLVNTRGLTELIILQVGYSAKIVTAPLFLVLVVMALVTTALTGPLLMLIDRVAAGARWPSASRGEMVDDHAGRSPEAVGRTASLGVSKGGRAEVDRHR